MTWEQRQRSRHARGQGHRWVKLRARILARDCHLCQTSAAAGRLTPATAVNHIVPKSRGGSNGADNLQAIGADCHRDRTAAEAAGPQAAPPGGVRPGRLADPVARPSGANGVASTAPGDRGVRSGFPPWRAKANDRHRCAGCGIGRALEPDGPSRRTIRSRSRRPFRFLRQMPPSGPIWRSAQRAFAASRTASTWPGTLTFFHTCAMRPSPSTRKVVRSIPMYFFPYMAFSTHTP